MIWSDSNSLFNDAFFLLMQKQEKTNLFPIWKSFSFRQQPVQQLLEAEKKLDESMRLNQNLGECYFLKAIIQRHLNQHDDAVANFQLAREKNYYLLACNIYLAEYFIYKFKFEEALVYLNEINAVYPNNSRVCFLLALIHLETFNFEESKVYLRILNKKPALQQLVAILAHNLLLTEEIVRKTTNRMVLKNFKLKSYNYNLQLKTNLINALKAYDGYGINYDVIECFLHGLTLKNLTTYPKFDYLSRYNVSTISAFITVEPNVVKLRLDAIDFDTHFVYSFEEYQEVENLTKEDF